MCSLSREALFPVATAASSPHSILQFSMTSCGTQLHNPKEKREKSRPLQLWMSLNQTSIRAFSEAHLGRLMDAAPRPPRFWVQSLDRNHHLFQFKEYYMHPNRWRKHCQAPQLPSPGNPFLRAHPPSPREPEKKRIWSITHVGITLKNHQFP